MKRIQRRAIFLLARLDKRIEVFDGLAGEARLVRREIAGYGEVCWAPGIGPPLSVSPWQPRQSLHPRAGHSHTINVAEVFLGTSLAATLEHSSFSNRDVVLLCSTRDDPDAIHRK